MVLNLKSNIRCLGRLNDDVMESLVQFSSISCCLFALWKELGHYLKNVIPSKLVFLIIAFPPVFMSSDCESSNFDLDSLKCVQAFAGHHLITLYRDVVTYLLL